MNGLKLLETVWRSGTGVYLAHDMGDGRYPIYIQQELICVVGFLTDKLLWVNSSTKKHTPLWCSDGVSGGHLSIHSSVHLSQSNSLRLCVPSQDKTPICYLVCIDLKISRLLLSSLFPILWTPIACTFKS